ncbi:MAG: hypothetical protein V3T88_07920 [Nitrosomonadaceae bacterium]
MTNHPDIQQAIDEFKAEMLKREIKYQELDFDELTKEESDEIDKMCGLSRCLIRQAF